MDSTGKLPRSSGIEVEGPDGRIHVFAPGTPTDVIDRHMTRIYATIDVNQPLPNVKRYPKGKSGLDNIWQSIKSGFNSPPGIENLARNVMPKEPRSTGREIELGTDLLLSRVADQMLTPRNLAMAAPFMLVEGIPAFIASLPFAGNMAYNAYQEFKRPEPEGTLLRERIANKGTAVADAAMAALPFLPSRRGAVTPGLKPGDFRAQGSTPLRTTSAPAPIPAAPPTPAPELPLQPKAVSTPTLPETPLPKPAQGPQPPLAVVSEQPKEPWYAARDRELAERAAQQEAAAKAAELTPEQIAANKKADEISNLWHQYLTETVARKNQPLAVGEAGPSSPLSTLPSLPQPATKNIGPLAKGQLPTVTGKIPETPLMPKEDMQWFEMIRALTEKAQEESNIALPEGGRRDIVADFKEGRIPVEPKEPPIKKGQARVVYENEFNPFEFILEHIGGINIKREQKAGTYPEIKEGLRNDAYRRIMRRKKGSTSDEAIDLLKDYHPAENITDVESLIKALNSYNPKKTRTNRDELDFLRDQYESALQNEKQNWWEAITENGPPENIKENMGLPRQREPGEEGFAAVSKKDQKGFSFEPITVQGQSQDKAALDLINRILQAPDAAVSKKDLLGLAKKKPSKPEAETPLFGGEKKKGLFGGEEGFADIKSTLPEYILQTRGRWFTPDLKYARFHAGPDGIVKYVDVPKELFNSTDYKSLPDRPERILPQDWASKAEVMSIAPSIRPGFVRLYRGEQQNANKSLFQGSRRRSHGRHEEEVRR